MGLVNIWSALVYRNNNTFSEKANNTLNRHWIKTVRSPTTMVYN